MLSLSALSVLSVAIFCVDGSLDTLISVQDGRISTMKISQAVYSECIQAMEMPVQKVPFLAMTQAFFGPRMPQAGDCFCLVAAALSLSGCGASKALLPVAFLQKSSGCGSFSRA